MMESNNYTTNKSTASGQPSALTQQANDAKEAVKSTVAETTANVKQQARQAVNEAQSTVSELAADAKQTATEKLGEAKARAESVVDERKTQTADRLQGIAGALRETSTKLQDQEEDTFASYAATAADQVDKFSGYLRNQNVGDLLQDVESFARRQPELFLAGTLAAGFLLGRFFKSSAASRTNQVQRYEYYPRTGQTADNVYGTPPQQSQYGAPSYGSSYDANTGSNQYGTPAYQGNQGVYDPQSGRPNQRDWSGTSESSTSVNSGNKGG